jgi:hypothetical protein
MQTNGGSLRHLAVRRLLRLSLAAALACLGGCSAHGSQSVFSTPEGNPDGGGPSFGDATPVGPCVNLQCQQVQCAGGGHTTVSGTVFAPSRQYGDPLYNAVVYVPNAKVLPFSDGPSCDQCGTVTSGSPVVATLTDAGGHFTLIDAPSGDNIPLVIQIGRWRSQLVVPHIDSCVDNPIAPSLTHLPRNHYEGDMPRMAMATGAADDIECVLRKIGIDDAEFTPPTGAGHIHYYVADGANLTRPAPSATTLWGDLAVLRHYDMVLLPCEGAANYKPPAAVQNMIDYTSAGGRMFTTHYGYVWIQGAPQPFSTTAVWTPEGAPLADPLEGDVNVGFPKGAAFAQWLQTLGASAGNALVDIVEPRHDVQFGYSPAQSWITTSFPLQAVVELSFNTPVGVAPENQCGKVVYSDFHVVPQLLEYAAPSFPNECHEAQTLTPQERVIEFMLFDLASCIQSDGQPPAPPQSVK